MKSIQFKIFAVALVLLTGFAGTALAGDFYAPVGNHDRADCSKLAGWAKDGDTTLPIQVHFYKGAPFPFGTYVSAVVANLYRSDLPFADKNHGFVVNTPAAYKTGCSEKVYIHAINVDTNGNISTGNSNNLLGNTGRTVRCGDPDPSCFGGKPGFPGSP